MGIGQDLGLFNSQLAEPSGTFLSYRKAVGKECEMHGVQTHQLLVLCEQRGGVI